MKRYEKKHIKKSLTATQIGKVYAKLILKKKVADFIVNSGIPVNAYYRAMEGKQVKAEYANKLLNLINVNHA